MSKPATPSSPLSAQTVKQLGTNIQTLRAVGGWTVRSLAPECRMAFSSIHLLESALHGSPSLKTVDTVARVLGVTTGSLLGASPQPRIRRQGSISHVLAGNLVAARKSLKLSQEKLGELAGVSRTQIARLEAEERNPSVDTLARLAFALQTDVEELLTPRLPSEWSNACQ